MVTDIQGAQDFFSETEEELVSLQTIDSFEMLREIISYSSALAEYPAELMTAEYQVHGCQSTVYVYAELKDGRVVFQAYSDAQVLRGYLGILLSGLNGLTPAEFLSHAGSIVEGFARRTNIAASVTPTRANAFGNIFELMEKQVRGLAG